MAKDVKEKPNTAKTETLPVPPATEETSLSAQTKELNDTLLRLKEKEKSLDEALEKAKTMQALPQISAEEAANIQISHKSKAQKMKEHLAKQVKVKIFVPLEGKEKPGSTLPVILNGYRLNVPKGRYVEVPEQVAQTVMDSLNQTEEAVRSNFNLENASDKTKDALNV